ncbi:MAG: 50S ribosomal protein L23 [Omnitrophica WOR_2 bacterium RIFCSPLOWO2_12_FULL_46_30]|nr:MAG: 50S ribosomal protein L23 [Omnitrophica WOR_2 bacterium RIFCSPHIGHO2_02_FULL_46_37]OGX43036.1 MAG: 50S ribosomal protein L23 [Omnitrophica WOR_2 bacterium RIFCSPLOWO2_02_FULL_45_28]OGX49904.1 MAG: 50S ribosomal protein L23 [Omnitrophica WOR_2 bacterium RIFCSPLOWO2_12_FULL_46_30]
MTEKKLYDIIKTLLRTEKATIAEGLRKYLFLVAYGANKIQIRKAVEEIYGVKVEAVNTRISAGKLRRVRHQPGYEPDQKKALVTLKEGNKIETT